MYKYLPWLLAIALSACESGNKKSDQSYVLAVEVEAYDKKGKDTVVPKMETDTVVANSAVAAYSKGVQKYAAVLMHIQQFPDSIKGTKGLKIWDEQGNDIIPSIPQNQRDSVIMNFIQFARRSTIPYYDRVKDFELKLMTAR